VLRLFVLVIVLIGGVSSCVPYKDRLEKRLLMHRIVNENRQNFEDRGISVYDTDVSYSPRQFHSFSQRGVSGRHTFHSVQEARTFFLDVHNDAKRTFHTKRNLGVSFFHNFFPTSDRAIELDITFSKRKGGSISRIRTIGGRIYYYRWNPDKERSEYFFSESVKKARKK